MASLEELRNAKELGKTLRITRQKLGLSLLSVANRSGLSISIISALENGNHFTFIKSAVEQYEYANAYAKALNIEISNDLNTLKPKLTESPDLFIPYFLRKKL